jgi:hypothetical protein
VASLAPALLHLLAHATRIGPARAFERACADVRASQTARLMALLRQNQDSEYGRAHGFAEVRSPEEYARRVPLSTAKELDPWVRRQMEGERNLLTAEPPIYYTRSTGSTGAPKHIPITESYRKEFQQTVHVALYHLRRRFPAAFLGRALYFVGSRRMARAADGNDVGTMSGFNYSEMPKLVRAVYAWPQRLFEVADLRTRAFLALLYASVGDTSIIAGIFPAPIVYLLRDLAEHAPALALALRDGELPGWLQLSPEQRAGFAKDLGRDGAAARRLTRAARAPEEEKAAEAWPSLRLVYCWTGATAGLYLPELQRRVGPRVAVRDAIYAATEGWCSVPMGEAEPGGALAVTSHYFEFLEEEAAARGAPETDLARGGAGALPAWALEDGKRYAIVVSNSAGLYRYSLQDIVEVCGFHGGCPRIRFVRKTGAACNLVGEKLDEAHVNGAVAQALRTAGVEATFFALAPAPQAALPGYALLLELRGPADAALLEAIRARADAALGEAAADYARLRAALHLAPLQIRSLPAGTYNRVRQSKIADGSAEAQLKTAHLVSDAASLPEAIRSALGETA